MLKKKEDYMRKSFIAGVLALCVGVAASHAELKIGYIDSEEIFAQYEGTKVAQEKLSKEVAKIEQDVSRRQKEITELKDQLEKQSLILTDERKKELEDSLKAKMIAYQEFINEKFGQRGEVQQKNVEMTKPIVEKIQKILDKIAAEENYDFIFDARAGGVVSAKPAYNLNKRVLELLNKEK